MDEMLPWRRLGSRLAWILALSFVIATVITGLLALNVTAPEPNYPADGTVIDTIFAQLQNQSVRWPQDLAASVLYALGFGVIGVLGLALRRILDRDSPAAMLVAATFLMAAVVGLLSQLAYIGAKEVAITPYYCDCEFRAAELMSRNWDLNVVMGIQGWLVDGFSVLFATGLLAAAGLARAAGWPGEWVMLTRVLAVAGLASVGWNRVVVPLLINAQVDIDYGLIGLGILAVIAGLLTPIWAAGVAMTLAAKPEPEASA